MAEIKYTPEKKQEIVDMVTKIYSRDPKNFTRVMHQFGIFDVDPPVYENKKVQVSVPLAERANPWANGLTHLKEKGAVILRSTEGHLTEDPKEPIAPPVIQFALPKTTYVRAPEFWIHEKCKRNAAPDQLQSKIPNGWIYHKISCSFAFREENPKTAEQLQAILDRRIQNFLTWSINIHVPPKRPKKPNKTTKKAMIKDMKNMKPPRSQRPPRKKNESQPGGQQKQNQTRPGGGYKGNNPKPQYKGKYNQKPSGNRNGYSGDQKQYGGKPRYNQQKNRTGKK